MISLEAGFHLLRQALERHQKFVILAHKNPDADTLGSALALYHLLISNGKEADVVCISDIPEYISFIPGCEAVLKDFSPDAYDVIISCDSAAPHLTGFDKKYPEIFEEKTRYNVINIDHHANGQPFGNTRIIDIHAAATASIIYRIFMFHSWKITPCIATCLMTGIITDTGSFQHSNTDADTLRISARLLAHGANLRSIEKEIFKTKKISTLKLWGKVFSNIIVDQERGVVSSAITNQDLEECDAESAELTGVIDYLNSVEGGDFSLLLSEQGAKVKGSLRTMREEIDVAEIASKVGGGGHTKAAGFSIDGHIKPYVGWRVVSEEEETDTHEKLLDTQKKELQYVL